MKATDLRRLDTSAADFDTRLQELLRLPDATDREIEQRVASIIDDVRARGDAALLDYTARFDGIDAPSVASLEVPNAELRAALDAIAPAQRRALESAAARIREFHQRQLEACGRGFAFRDEHGSLLGQKVTPLDRVGIYVPGGKAAYPSSALMNAIPAQVAGVGEIVMAVPTPARRDSSSKDAKGERNPLVLAAAALSGVHRVFTIGGAQAIAALAYGTVTVPRVDKITGPGNAYVATAKRRVFGQVGIDMIAGPSEILVLADGTTPADWVAMDLFSQAEHDELAQSILLCPERAYLDAVGEAIERLLPSQPRRDVIRVSLQGRGALILTRSMDEACAIADRIAPEHVEIASREPYRWEPLLKHAGAIFLGAYASESLGDYCAGPNHVLPTSGTARFSSPLGVYDFCKRSSLIEVSRDGAQPLGAIAVELAEGEGLHAHAEAARLRLDGSPPTEQQTPARIELRPITRENLRAIAKLAVGPAQQAFVAPNAFSIAESAYEITSRLVGIYVRDEPVGLLLLHDTRRDPDEPADELYVWRLMIDAAHQRRGYGADAMRWVIDEARRLGVARVGLSHVVGNDAAGAFYERLGFRYTGRIDDGEREMVLPLGKEAT